MKKIFPIALILAPTIAAANPDLPDSATLTKEYLSQLSQRKRGQTAFVVKNQIWNPRMERESTPSQEAGRSVQESDVFKIGNRAKKEMFLLNNFRGFQVVSFEDGLERPKLVGRLPIYNTWGSEMYYLATQEKVIILNTEWSTAANSWGMNYSTKLYMVNVADSKNPTIEAELSLSGYLQESRLVGDVLYTITHNGHSEKKVKITSVKISGDIMEEIEESELHSDKKFVQTMNVVEENKRYYVVSTLGDWGQSGDLVNVHDITSPNGKIHKTFTAKVRGRITERSQTFLHKSHLFAVSNYQENDAPSRVSVEAFPLQKSETLVTSKPNMRVSVGDTNGLHASLQDVRVSGDHLYAFWVPANNVDPFELFDISRPQDGIKHLGQLQFDGWISKAFPLNYQGREYVLGLGWVTPVTSENGKRLPQAKLFEVKKKDGKVQHEVVASLTIENEEIWTSLNSEDKFFEIIDNGPGKFNVLFPVTFKKNWKDGAKIITADLNKHELDEGASVQGEEGWLRRIFTNKDLHSLHAFSNERLENFDESKLTERGLTKTVSVLELARNILSFHQINDGEGVQIVAKENTLEVRTVGLKQVDAEKSEVLDIRSIQGSHIWHKVMNNKLYAVTAIYEENDDRYWNRKFTQANLTVLDLSTKGIKSSKIDIDKTPEYYYFSLRNISSDNQELFVIGTEFFRLEGDRLQKIVVKEECAYFFNNDSGNLHLQSFGKDVLAFNSFKLKPSQEEKFAYYMPFFKVLDIQGNEVGCSRSVNVPGRPVLVTGDYMVASEDLDDWYDYESFGLGGVKDYFPGRRYSSSSRTVALKLEDTGARMTDFLKENIAGNTFDKGFVTFDNNQHVMKLWGLDEDGEFLSKPFYLEDTEGDANLVALKSFSGRSFAFLQSKQNLSMFEVTSGRKIKPVEITAGAKAIPFSIESISASKDLKKFFLSQGMYGVSEIQIK